VRRKIAVLIVVGRGYTQDGACPPRRVLHSWSNGEKVYLELYRQRWLCRGCRHSFRDGTKLVRLYSRITKQAEQEVLWQLKDGSVSQVERELGLSYTSLLPLLEGLAPCRTVSMTFNKEPTKSAILLLYSAS